MVTLQEQKVHGAEVAHRVNELLRELKSSQWDEKLRREPVNWGSLRVVEVSLLHELYPAVEEPRYVVTLEEVSPSATYFCYVVQKLYSEKYGVQLEVRSEW